MDVDITSQRNLERAPRMALPHLPDSRSALPLGLWE
jgi:hypothetical protein